MTGKAGVERAVLPALRVEAALLAELKAEADELGVPLPTYHRQLLGARDRCNRSATARESERGAHGHGRHDAPSGTTSVRVPTSSTQGAGLWPVLRLRWSTMKATDVRP